MTAALRSGPDVWGNELLRAPGGPTLAGARRYLAPLLYAKTSRGRSLTDSGVYYVALGVPGTPGAMLHVADGSEIVARRAGGRTLVVRVGNERYGSCLARLTPARLADGWLPVLQTSYRDARGVRWTQESFAWRDGGKLASFVRIDASRPARARLGALTVRTPAFATWSAARVRLVDAETYATARGALAAYWNARLAAGAFFDVPEPAVANAERNLLVQNLTLTWRYSLGNPYEEFSFPESVDDAQVLAEYGFADVAGAMLRAALPRRPTPYPNWKRGEKLLGAATHWRLHRDARFLAEVTPTLATYVDALARQLDARGLLARERYSSDIADSVYGLHSQAVAWQGLREIADAWAASGRPELARRAHTAAARLERGLRARVPADARRLGDGSLFVPMRLVDREGPYDALTESRAASYWNLVAPYAFASRLFAPHGRDAGGALSYLLRHGSRLLGLVRAGGYALYPQGAYSSSGTDQVYGLNAARFIADNDVPDQLVLSLYGQLAAGMTPGTYVAGEGATVAPLHGDLYRSMYLPPNSASNAAFLETLRLTLVHETPAGLELAYATPRAWLAPGRHVAVRDAPTSFGPLSYSIDAGPASAHVVVGVPSRARPRVLRLRLRLPGGRRLAAVTLGGTPFPRFNASTGTIDLSGRMGTLDLVARYAPR